MHLPKTLIAYVLISFQIFCGAFAFVSQLTGQQPLQNKVSFRRHVSIYRPLISRSSIKQQAIQNAVVVAEPNQTIKPTTNENESSQPSKLAKLWRRTGFFLLPALAVIPFLQFGVKKTLSAWYTPFLGIIAASLPSGGAPVAGGIVFLPMLIAGGLSAKQAVAFSACTQTFGCGIFAPLNWLSQNPKVLFSEVIPVALIPGVLGCLTALFFAPISSIAVEKFFSIFCVFLAMYVVHGLSNDLTTNNEPVEMNFKTNLIYAVSCYAGGLITGWIGIGIEKILFVLLTSYPHKADLKRACLTSIAIVGWVSFFSALVHLFILKDVPLLFWACGLPGVFIGSKVGPIINKKLGPRNVMKVFTFMLLVDSLKKIQKLFFL